MQTNFKIKERTEKELAIRFKRQRAATETLHKLARAKGIQLETDAIAKPYRVVFDEDAHTRKGFYEYVIVSADKSKLLTFNMISGQERILTNDGSIVLSGFSPLDLMSRGLTPLVSMAISEEMPSYGGSVQVGFVFDQWFVLEILSDGHYFYEQRAMTEKLRKFADENGLGYHIHCRDKLASRAKLADVDGKTCWSLRCEKNEGVYYVICDMDGNIAITTEHPRVWVLQQRVAAVKIASFAKKDGIQVNNRPLLAYVDNLPVWAVYTQVNGKDSFVICPIDGSEVKVVPYKALKSIADMKQDKFLFNVFGKDMYAKQWLEAEFAPVMKEVD